MKIVELIKACALQLIGQVILSWEDVTEDKAKKGMQYLDNSRKISEAFGAVEMTKAAEKQIAHYRAKCIRKFGAQEAFGTPETKEQVIERCRASYDMSVEQSGDVLSLTLGSNLATELMN
jgi:hypothetical protein